jgi:polysaccharide pyruvyl transferase WcaK-like protein
VKIWSIVSLRTLYENLGDLTINACLVSRLSQTGKVLCITSSVPLWYLEQFREAVDKHNGTIEYHRTPISILAWIGRAMVSGGQILVFMSPGAVQFTVSHQRTILYLVSKFVRNLHFAQVGASYAELDPKTMRLLRTVVCGKHYLSVRDPASQQELARHGISVPLVPDLAFAMGRQPSLERRYLVLNFRASKEETEKRLTQRLTPIVALARNYGLEPIVFWQVNADRDLAHLLADRLGIKVAAGLELPRPTLAQAREIYERSAAICSNRLHGLLIAAAYGALPFALLRADEQKVANCFLDNGLSTFVSKRAEDDAALLADLAAPQALSREVDAAFATAGRRIDAYFADLGA